MKIRPLESADAAACYEMRKRAFIEVFSRYMGERSMAAGVDAYAPSEFARRLADMPTAVATAGGEPIGFCTVRRLDDEEAELLWLYVRLDHLRRGIGSRLARHAEETVKSRFPGVSRIVLVTAVPDYNQAFYEALGYKKVGVEAVHHPTGSIPMVKMSKELARDRRH